MTTENAAVTAVADAPKAEKKVATKKPAKKQAPKMTAKLKEAAKKQGYPTNKCMCGCGGMTKSNFMPGHDARYKGELQRAHRNGGLSAKQKADVAKLNWDRFMRSAEENHSEVAAAQEAGITLPQAHVLRVLVAKGGLTRSEIAEKAKVTMNMTDVIGPTFKEDVAKVEKRIGRKTLLGLKYVSLTSDERDGRDVVTYTITAAGRKAYDKFKAAR